MAKLKEEVREKITFWCHEKYAARPKWEPGVSGKMLKSERAYVGTGLGVNEPKWERA